MEPNPERVEAESWLGSRIRLDRSLVIFAAIVLLAVLTRFAGLGDRVMSHDETTHVYFSWQLEQGRGYAHDPLSHGPLQFHLLALSYYLFGDNDASARLPAAVSGVAARAADLGFPSLDREDGRGGYRRSDPRFAFPALLLALRPQ